jgi:hypothetical protein
MYLQNGAVLLYHCRKSETLVRIVWSVRRVASAVIQCRVFAFLSLMELHNVFIQPILLPCIPLFLCFAETCIGYVETSAQMSTEGRHVGFDIKELADASLSCCTVCFVY